MSGRLFEIVLEGFPRHLLPKLGGVFKVVFIYITALRKMIQFGYYLFRWVEKLPASKVFG